MDKISRKARSRNMAHIRAKNTQPEILLRKALYKLGLRYRIYYSLPGKPDVTFPLVNIAIFVHGCFWHRHGCKNDHKPKTNKRYWITKIAKNKERDKKINNLLTIQGWDVITVWECEINNIKVFQKKIKFIVKEYDKRRKINITLFT